jgi:membrane-associated phospholipid phosphatase
MFIYPSKIFCQDSLPTIPNAVYWKSYWTDSKKIAIFPKYLGKKDWIFVGTSVGLGAGLYFLDEKINELFLVSRSQASNEIVKYGIRNWGDFSYPLIAIGTTYAAGWIFKSEREKRIALLDLKTLALAGVFSRIPKVVFQRHRPENGNMQADLWEGPFNGLTGNYSFPSGHSFIAFSLASVTASEYKEKRGLVIALYSIASMVAVSRVYENKHWASDAFIGAAMGYGFGKLVYRFNNKINDTKIPSKRD